MNKATEKFNLPIASTVLIEEALSDYMSTAEEIGSMGIKGGLAVTLFQNEHIPFTRVARIVGLGTTLHMCYVFAPGHPDDIGLPATDTDTFFKDFQNYVMWEAGQDHVTPRH